MLPAALIEKALAFATVAHAGAFRKWTGEPYIIHPTRVAARLVPLGFGAEVIAAAFLHDVIEDTDTTAATLAAEFGPAVAALVLEVTKPKVEGDRAFRNAAFRNHLAASSYAGASINLSDKLDNSRNVAALDPVFAKGYLAEMRQALKVLQHGHPVLVLDLIAALA